MFVVPLSKGVLLSFFGQAYRVRLPSDGVEVKTTQAKTCAQYDFAASCAAGDLASYGASVTPTANPTSPIHGLFFDYTIDPLPSLFKFTP